MQTGNEQKTGLGAFERYLTVWVGISIVAGILLGQVWPALPRWMAGWEYKSVSLPIALLIWLMICPMMLQIDFGSIVRAGRKPKGLILTLVINWLIKPFTMFGIAYLFLRVFFAPWITPDVAQYYLAGAILLGAAPCTAMVFVWSYLTDGDPGYTLVQVAVNDLVLLVLFAPIVMFLLGVSNLVVPWATVFLSVVLFVVIPLVLGYLTRSALIRRRGEVWFQRRFLPSLKPVTIVALLLTLVLIFSTQGETIIRNPLHILLIAIPLTIQTYLIFFLGYLGARWLRLDRGTASPAAMIGASNFFELAVAVAISLFGLQSPAAVATVVGVLVEVPVMLSLVGIANRTKHWFPAS